jgi:hypothetical protein
MRQHRISPEGLQILQQALPFHTLNTIYTFLALEHFH